MSFGPSGPPRRLADLLHDVNSYFNLAMAVLITEDDFEALTLAYMTKVSSREPRQLSDERRAPTFHADSSLYQVHGDGLVHAEIFFDPQVSRLALPCAV